MASGVILSLLLSVALTFGADWPQWRGPALDGISRETNWTTQWPAEGPKQLWKAFVGIGFSTVSVSQGRVFTMGNQKDVDTIHCLDAETGRVLWQHRYDCELDPRYYEGGPGGTPTVSDGRVYSLSKKGHVFCLEAATGKVIWSRDVRQEQDLKLPEWSFAGSPLIAGDLVILNVGSAGTALDKRTGRVAWTSGKEAAGYATPVPFQWKGSPAVAVFSAKAIIAVETRTGRELWRHAWESSRDVNAADPIIIGDKLFLSSSTGALLLDLSPEKPVPVWEHKLMRNYFNPCVLLDGHLYGLDGTTHRPTRLVCMELATGKVRWAEEGFGSGGLMAADGRLIIFDKGQLSIVRAQTERYQLLARASVIGGKCWTAPVLAGGLVYGRNAAGDLICLDLRAGSSAAKPASRPLSE